MGFLRSALIVLLLLSRPWTCSGDPADFSSTDIALEYKVKAAFIFNFARFVDWPDNAAAPAAENPIVIGVIGHDLLTPYLKAALDGKLVEGRPLSVVRLKAIVPDAKLHILYVARSEVEKVASLVEAVRKRPVLTVSEARGFLEQGGMVKLGVEDNRVSFAVDLEAIQRAPLTVSSQMLQYAKVVN